MTTDEFVTKYNNEKIDFDGYYGPQCMDLYRQFVKEVLGYPQSPGVAGAKDVWDTYLKKYFKRIENTPTGIPKKGDIVIWGTKIGEYGHIAVFLEGDANSFVSFDQNFPVGTLPHKQSHSYSGVLGWLTPIEVTVPAEDANKVIVDKLEAFRAKEGYGNLEGALNALLGDRTALKALKIDYENLKKEDGETIDTLNKDWQAKLDIANKTIEDQEKIITSLEQKEGLDKYTSSELLKEIISRFFNDSQKEVQK